ncbi:AAA family ATPase [Pseudomonas sp. Irchel 3A7]|uniref:AAA family ATPase n=1 Tax=Pseudomonas sp. Irchel 3A7 TaxID=2008913 RepID=UPI000BA3AB63|nr:AAA family ATPase [Pseudomonas sp. Irchel 3A7]
MHIERVQIEEGFLDGLDVSFAPGLNVIIGARGTGKTSLIEIIRYCLDVTSTTSDTTKRSKEHALSVLGSGQVTVTLSENDQKIVVTRTANDLSPRITSPFKKPVVFSQTEIETVGLESAGRLRLIDGFVSSQGSTESHEREIVGKCRALTSQAETYRREIDELEQQLTSLPILTEELQKIIAAEQEVSKTSITLNEKTQALNIQSSAISKSGVFVEQITRLSNDIAAWSHIVKQAADASPSYSLNLASPEAELIEPFRDRIKSVSSRLNAELHEVIQIYHALVAITQTASSEKIVLEDKARQLRQEVDAIQAGSGSILRRGQELREQIAKLNSIASYITERKSFLAQLITERSAALDELDQIRYKRFAMRQQATEWLNSIVGPNIKLSVLRNGQSKIFSAAIAEALRGSGIRYADIAETLALHISPRALVEAVDNFDVELIEQAAGITADRASRILSHLKGYDLSELCTICIEDEASLQLLDGSDYKDINELSTGQRCTVVLPLILSHMSRMLIVDQPEDHIDNAFIADTLIRVILSRGDQGQIIFSTHNPNIPVLGDADSVLHLGSDGRRGFKISAGALHDEKIVHAISTVMEGGAKAFATRASFYGDHG